jgi:hypothetical protein
MIDALIQGEKSATIRAKNGECIRLASFATKLYFWKIERGEEEKTNREQDSR